MLILTQKEVQKILPLPKIYLVIERVERAFYDHRLKKIQMPAKIYLYFKKEKGDLRIMPSFSPVLKMAGTKIVNVHPENPKRGLKTVMAVIILNEAKTGLPLALMDGTYITGMRTGAAGALATKYLARKNSRILGVVGAGQQAIFQIAAISKVREIEKVLAFDIQKERVENLKKIFQKEKLQIEYRDISQVVKNCDILVTVTPSEKPIVKAEWVKPGLHINAVGADAKGKEELDPQILKKAKIVVDSWEQASHSGEINVPLAKGIISKKDIYANLGEIVAKIKPGRKDEKEITIFDSTGLSIQDLYTAELVYQMAKKEKIGREIEII